jgi:hypothetical protein
MGAAQCGAHDTARERSVSTSFKSGAERNTHAERFTKRDGPRRLKHGTAAWHTDSLRVRIR